MIVIESARASDLRALRLRVLYPGRPEHLADYPGDDAPTTHHLVARQGSKGPVVGVVTLTPRPLPSEPWDHPWPAATPRPDVQLRGMATAPEVRGTGVGLQLVERARADLARPLWCNARVAAIGFYERAGWRVMSEPFDVPGIGPHRRMVSGP